MNNLVPIIPKKLKTSGFHERSGNELAFLWLVIFILKNNQFIKI
jgi:hypothetical protein